MKQLFVFHTQYNLILATGFVYDEPKQNDLILFKDFALTEELQKRLEDLFDRVLLLEGNFTKRKLSVYQKYLKIKRDCKEIKIFINEVYERVFIVGDVCVQEMATMKYAYYQNTACEFAWLEDGSNAYFHNGVSSGGLGRNAFLRFVRKHLLSCLYSLHGFYDLGKCFGDHRLLTKIYVTFPEYVRHELKHKLRQEITQQQFFKGMQFMYQGKPYHMFGPSVIFAMDKLSIYGDQLPIVDKIISQEVEEALKAGKTIYCKYHPRETEKLPALSQSNVLDSKIAMEYYLTNTTNKDITVIGIKSTSLQSSRKMGFETVSLKLSDNNDMYSFYNKIGIIVRQ